MADQTCPGCQSFCMLGGQIVSSSPVIKTINGKTYRHEKKETYPTEWKNWETIQFDDTIQTTGKLTATSQNDLINYIKAAWDEGNINASKIADSIKDWNDKHPGGINGNKPSIETLKSFNDTGITKAKAAQEQVIHDYHYNNLCNVLAEEVSAETSDLKGDPTGNPQTSGPRVGEASDRQTNYEDRMVHSQEDLIKATYYNTLYEKASKLMYHPYQCNYCNIYEGGGFGEIVRELGSAIMENNPIYSWNKRTSLEKSVAGVSGITFRQDCSGFVGACLSVYSVASGITNAFNGDQCASVQYETTAGLNQYGVAGQFTQSSSGSGCKGMIFADSNHVEASDDKGVVWSGGGSGECLNGQLNECHEAPIMMNYGCGQKPPRWQANEYAN